MVGIVIVSHSKKLAEGVRELAAQMVQDQVPFAIAAGIDDPDNSLGTDAMEIYEAIASIFTDDGVVVLMDLGSALLSAEMALDFLTEDKREKVHLCAAPLVEGAIAAAVAAAAGSNIEQVKAEARGALVAKATQLGVDSGQLTAISGDEQPTTNEAQQPKEIRVSVRNRLGLHARPAAQFVTTVARFQSQIRVQNLTRGTESVRADSINQVAMLGVRQGHELAITAQGIDADEALAALQALVESNFGEDEVDTQPIIPSLGAETPPLEPISQPPHLSGIPTSPGVAIAPIFLYRPTVIKANTQSIENVNREWQRLQTAMNTAEQEIQALLSHTSTQIGDTEAAIFDAHLMFLEDPTLIEAVHQGIFEHHLNAEAAWERVVDELAARYHLLDSDYMQGRVIDVIDVGQRVLRSLAGSVPTNLNLDQPAILVANDLTPSDTVQLDATKVLGICITSGSATSHSAIIARALGIPAIVGVAPEILHLKNGTVIAVDGETGKIWVEVEPETLAKLQTKRDAWQTVQRQARTTAYLPARTRDAYQVNVLANINGIADAQAAVELGAEGVGLLRTEFLFLDRETTPTQEEQLTLYHAIAQVLDKRPLIIRTLDVGGDKPLPYLSHAPEANPFLGLRGIRFSLAYPDIFKTQLRAILQASPGHQIKIMFPMIATVAEVQAAKAILAEVQAELQQAGIPFDESMEVGIMVEVPAAVAIADQLAVQVDFFSIGTNDLCQYIMACDRTNPQVATLADPLHPAVLRMIQQTVQAGHAVGIPVGLCGELAANPQAAAILLGLGLDELSLNPQAIPTLKQAIAQFTLPQAEAIAQAALQQDSTVFTQHYGASEYRSP